MPRENRKRGKKNKKKILDDEDLPLPEQLPTGEPSWIRSAPSEPVEINPEAPFGFVDPDVKAYFRTVDVQIRDWQDAQPEDAGSDDVDPNEQRHLFFVAALTEMGGKELQLATDPDCSVILERMAYSMDDFVRRVFMDSLAGSFERLVRHRFASHVCQTFFTVAKETISREARGIFPNVPEASERGELRTLTQLIIDAAEELLPAFSSLILDPFASHVLRALLCLLSPNVSPSNDSGNNPLRSKKSAAWKAKQGQMRSLFGNEKGKVQEPPPTFTPPEFRELARRFVEVVRAKLDENEVRALAANKVASPGLQILLEVEADHDITSEAGSLMDRVTIGIITACHNGPNPDLQPSDYLNTLLRDPTSSHLLETIVCKVPENAFAALWLIYFNGKLARLAVHPVANFVLAKALERVSVEQLSAACAELDTSWSKMIRSSRTGVLRAMIDRCAALHASESEISQAVYSAFDLLTPEDRALLVPCVLCLLPLQEYKTALATSSLVSEEQQATRQRSRMGTNNVMEPKVQGSILLQSLLRLSDPYNQVVTASINSLSIEERMKLAHDASSSRVYDVLLESPTIPLKTKRQFVMDFIGHYHALVHDRLGSRIGDRCWSFADTYLKEKIARSLVSQEQSLAGSYYGKFFARNLNLHLLQRRPDDWRTMQADRKRLQEHANKPVVPAANPTSAAATPPSPPPTKRKRKPQPEDAIDVVFNSTHIKKIKKAALDDVGSAVPSTVVEDKMSTSKKALNGLQDVLGAIRVAPKAENVRRKRGGK